MNKPVYKCPICGLRAATGKTIYDHIESDHPDKAVDIEVFPVQE